MTIGHLLAEAAQRRPEDAAILAPGRAPWSYGQLHDIVRNAAAGLREAGVTRPDRVAVVLPNGPEMAAAFLSVASAAVCAPLNPAYGKSELLFYLSDLKARALIIEEGSESPAAEAAAELNVPVIHLRAQAGGGDDAGANEKCSEDDVALVLHTSGTTSRPKIVPLTHRNLCRSADNIRRSLTLTRGDRCLNVMPLFHIHGLEAALLSSMAAGASVVATPGFHPVRFYEWLDEFTPSWYTAVPTMHQAILARAGNHRDVIERRRPRFIRSSSSALAPALMAELEQVFRAPVIEAYGMTEAAHQMTTNPLPPGHRKAGSVGLPAGVDVAIMDEAGNLLPAGETGEIVIRGENVTDGYEANPEANEKAFTNGWFRTGDQGRFDAHGYLYLTGRLKEIINRGGEKISPREVDEALLEHPGIAQAVTFAIPHSQLGEETGVAVVLREGAAMSEREVREFAASKLAEFKVPRVVRIVREVPKGPTGKLQRIGLAQTLGIGPIDPAREGGEHPFAAPRSGIEEQVAAVWRKVLGTERAGRDDSFFALGGDSVLAAELLSRVTVELNVALPFLVFLEEPTLAGMARRIEEAQRRGGTEERGSGSLIPIQTGGALPPLFCVGGHAGGLGAFCGFARHLDREQPVYGFAPPRLEDTKHDFRIEEYAEACLEQIRTRQPEGPYYLAGLCFGGLITYEIARRLKQDGQTVALLVMMDCLRGSGGRQVPLREVVARRVRRARRRREIIFGNLARRRAGERLTYLMERLQAFFTVMKDRAGGTLYSLYRTVGLWPPISLRQARYASPFARRLYSPAPYDGPVTLFRVKDLRPDIPMLGWEGLLRGEVRVFDVPFHPHGIGAEPLGPVAGSLLRQAMEEAQRKVRSDAS
ncbi:MAG TPA: AMP-binding protein [Bryobacteraceae bacterium]|nr:AMP-binding protein [Bryobacteraceae bacterium]